MNNQSMILLSPPELAAGQSYRKTFVLALVRLATYLRRTCPDLTVQILDPLSHSLDQMLDEVQKRKPTYVGINANSFTYSRALLIAVEAKKAGSTVILGGVHANAAKELIEVKRKGLIDHVVRGRGERFLELLVKGELSQQYNHIFLPLQDIFDVDLSLLPQAALDATLNHALPGSCINRAIPLQLTAGCHWRAKGGCLFCSVPDRRPETIAPGKIWQYLCEIQDLFGVRKIYETGDCFATNQGWIKEFADAKPDRANLKFMVYSRADTLTEEVVKNFLKIGVTLVYLGFESGSDELLARANKGTRAKDSFRAAKLLADYGIPITGTCVFGIPGENKKTLEQTLSLIQRVIALGNVYSIGGLPLIPYVGTRAYEELIGTKQGAKFRGDDNPNPYDLQEAYTDAFCGVSRQELQAAVDALLLMSPALPIYMGRPKQ